MTLDLYSYGRAIPADATTLDREDEELQTFVCGGCGCSATARDAVLVLTIGWRLLPKRAHADERPALCPCCARRFVSSLI
jgi:hypothetical protein